MGEHKNKKEAELKKRFAEMKRAHQEKPAQDEFSDEVIGTDGVISERNFKKNLGCGG
ncbi:MAG: hypothetical protein AAFQ94_20595 [Bacteroidota bacterium]